MRSKLSPVLHLAPDKFFENPSDLSFIVCPIGLREFFVVPKDAVKIQFEARATPIPDSIYAWVIDLGYPYKTVAPSGQRVNLDLTGALRTWLVEQIEAGRPHIALYHWEYE